MLNLPAVVDGNWKDCYVESKTQSSPMRSPRDMEVSLFLINYQTTKVYAAVAVKLQAFLN